MQKKLLMLTLLATLSLSTAYAAEHHDDDAAFSEGPPASLYKQSHETPFGVVPESVDGAHFHDGPAASELAANGQERDSKEVAAERQILSLEEVGARLGEELPEAYSIDNIYTRFDYLTQTMATFKQIMDKQVREIQNRVSAVTESVHAVEGLRRQLSEAQSELEKAQHEKETLVALLRDAMETHSQKAADARREKGGKGSKEGKDSAAAGGSERDADLESTASSDETGPAASKEQGKKSGPKKGAKGKVAAKPAASTGGAGKKKA